MDWFLYDRDLRHERVNYQSEKEERLKLNRRKRINSYQPKS